MPFLPTVQSNNICLEVKLLSDDLIQMIALTRNTENNANIVSTNCFTHKPSSVATNTHENLCILLPNICRLN